MGIGLKGELGNFQSPKNSKSRDFENLSKLQKEIYDNHSIIVVDLYFFKTAKFAKIGL